MNRATIALALVGCGSLRPARDADVDGLRARFDMTLRVGVADQNEQLRGHGSPIRVQVGGDA